MKRIGIIVGILVIVVIAFIAYTRFFAQAPTPAFSTETPSASSTVDQDLITLLLTLKNIHLDGTLFADSAYQSLQDFGKDLIPEPVGRPNPFAPLGAISAASKAGAQSSAGAPSIGSKK